MPGLTIGKLAASAGIGVETVRFYERKGLIDRPLRPAGGYRVYADESINRLGFIREAQDVGFTLKEIADLLTLRANPATDCAAMRGRAAAKLAQLEFRIEQFERMCTTLGGLLAECPGRGKLDTCSIVAALSHPAPGSRPARRNSIPRSRKSMMKAAELTIQGMHCEGCAKTVEALLSAEPGVKATTASYASGSARVLYDPAVADPALLAVAIARAGYLVTEKQ